MLFKICNRLNIQQLSESIVYIWNWRLELTHDFDFASAIL